jgi:Ca2+-binding EF-hand superfamily protein
MNMEELHMAAAAYYNNSSQQLQQLAANFFGSMDMNGDGRVSFDEFVAFFRHCGYHWIDSNFFRSSEHNGDNI